ncbi:uncharacterized protein LOC144324194 isoform X2 [Canis aureus]
MTICLLVKDIWMAYHSIYHIGPVICPTGIPKSRLAGYLWDPIHCLRGHDIKNLWVSGVQQFYAVYILLSTPHESPHLFLMTTDEKYVVFWNGEDEIQPRGSGGGHLKCSEEAAAWKSLIAPATDFSTDTERSLLCSIPGDISIWPAALTAFKQ